MREKRAVFPMLMVLPEALPYSIFNIQYSTFNQPRAYASNCNAGTILYKRGGSIVIFTFGVELWRSRADQTHLPQVDIRC